MARRIIVVGDPTGHGDTVISTSAGHTIDGKVIARLGDKVNCPWNYPNGAPHGVNPIVEGAASLFLQGIPVALKSHKTAYGCSLIGTTSAMHG
jgi:uncharacterized Zn-binding protein involved in type VI secretion